MKKPSTIRKSKRIALKAIVEEVYAKMNVFLGNEREEPVLSIESSRLYYVRNAARQRRFFPDPDGVLPYRKNWRLGARGWWWYIGIRGEGSDMHKQCANLGV